VEPEATPRTAGPPEEVYRKRLAQRRASVARHQRTEARLSGLRLAIALGGLLLGWPVVIQRTIAWYWLLLPLALFVTAAMVHDRVVRRRQVAQRAAEFYEHGLARLEDQWAGQGATGGAFLDPQHPYAADLDLFGHGSLFQLLCRARTRVGERTLASWLLQPPSVEEIRERQQAVRELRDNLALREALAVMGDELRGHDDPQALLRWSTAAPLLTSRWPVAAAAALSILVITGFLVWIAYPWGRFFFLGAALAGGLFAAWFHARVRAVLSGVEQPQRELERLAGILARLEVERFRSPLLRELHSALEVEGRPPSRRISTLARLVQLRDSQGNMLFKPFAAAIFFGTQLAFALERWRARSGAAVQRWVDAVGRVEALCSLAGRAFERPAEPFPEIVGSGPRLDALAVGHPLLPASRCVRNDLRLDAEQRMLLVSGSNMSGKSTLLRTVGVNAVLALAGGTVRAERLVLSPLRIGACMRVLDSLQEGRSHFYAEITRLRAIVDLGDQGHPLLFLLDEILHGTNSHDRRVGAEALIRGLLERGAVGLVTTHDLALATIADELAPRAANVHFEDRLEGQRIVFDYRLRPGVVRKGNALELMRAVGLKL
jgi:hypothetical protein